VTSLFEFVLIFGRLHMNGIGEPYSSKLNANRALFAGDKLYLYTGTADMGIKSPELHKGLFIGNRL
jgi:hypothetical protein